MKPNRDISDGPWCWQSKAALRAIREGFDEEHGVTSALAVYLALTELASDRASETFQTTHAWIGGMTGLSVRTVQDRIKGLAELGLVTVVTPKLRAPSAYTLHTSGTGCGTFGNSCVTSGNGCAAFGNGGKQASLPTLEEKEEREEREKNLPKTARKVNPEWEALAALDGWAPGNTLTKSASGRVGEALRQIREVHPGVTASEIRVRVAAYRRLYPTAPTTSTAISANWAKLAPTTAKREQPSEGFLQ